MSFNDEDIVFTIDAKRLIAIGLLAIITVATLSSYIIALFAWQASTGSDPLLKVMNLETQTSGGSQTPSFSQGDTVKVEATIEKASSYATPYTVLTEPTEARIFIVVLDADTTTYKLLHYYTITKTLYPGVPQDITTQFTLSSSAPIHSNYDVRCLVWSTYLPDGDTLTNWGDFNAEQEVTFSVS